jgi:hypothetical protein
MVNLKRQRDLENLLIDKEYERIEENKNKIYGESRKRLKDKNDVLRPCTMVFIFQ